MTDPAAPRQGEPQALTANDLIRAFDHLTRKAWPPNQDEVILNGDEWDGQLVVKVADVLEVVGKLARRLDQEQRRIDP